jgi:hypothetical protein
LSDFSLAEFIAAFERSDLGVFALFIHSPQTKFNMLTHVVCDERPHVVIERKKSGQCEYADGVFESVQFKAILKCEFEIVLNPNSKRSKLS